MTLPHPERAMIAPAKIRDYLLSTRHTVGRHKAAFFAQLGYSRRRWPGLESDLRVVAQTGTAVAGQPSDFGQKFEVSGILTGPSGRTAAVVTVWIVRRGEDFPRFVTVFPGE